MVCHYTADYQSGMHPPLFQLFMSTQRDKGRTLPSLVAMVAWDTSPRLFSNCVLGVLRMVESPVVKATVVLILERTSGNSRTTHC